jgi:integral membrane protein (TIGR01906 family)
MRNLTLKSSRSVTNLLWLLCCISLIILSFGLSWQIHKSTDFFYSFWYQQLNIEQTITTYVPDNTFDKKDYIDTNTEQRVDNFSEIVTQIHNNGEHLAQLSYVNKNQEVKKLLTPAEIIHLEDVSHLIRKLTLVSVGNLIILLLFSIVIYQKKLYLPKTKDQLLAVVLPCLLILALFILFGFTKLFYYLHTVIFPDNHQWFFYYQESLMSSLMKAPDLFAGISITLAVIALFIYAVFYRLLIVKIFRGVD